MNEIDPNLFGKEQEEILNDVVLSLSSFFEENNYFNLSESDLRNEVLIILTESNQAEYLNDKNRYLNRIKTILLKQFSDIDSYIITDPVKAYLRDIGKYKLLTEEEEKELFSKYLAGDQNSKNEIIERNLRLVVSVAKSYYKNTIPFSDLIQEGNIGLMRAVEKFDPSLGNRFSTYAVYWIRQGISRAITNTEKSIRIPVWVLDKLSKIRQYEGEYFKNNGISPTVKEIAEKLEITEEEILNLKQFDFDYVSMNKKINELEDTEYGDSIQSDEDIDEEVITSSLNDEIYSFFKEAKLNDDQIKVLIYRYGLNGGRPCTIEKTSKILGRTKERVRLTETKALLKLKLSPYKDKIRIYYDDNCDIDDNNVKMKRKSI